MVTSNNGLAQAETTNVRPACLGYPRLLWITKAGRPYRSMRTVAHRAHVMHVAAAVVAIFCGAFAIPDVMNVRCIPSTRCYRDAW